MRRRDLLGWLGLVALGLPGGSWAGEAPALMLANVYRPGVPLRDYWLSEKYDGIRGFWDGQRLLTRGGEWVAAPAWFTAGWPAEPMDGELWVGRGRFEEALSTVRQ
jgi:DNA ligase-1